MTFKAIENLHMHAHALTHARTRSHVQTRKITVDGIGQREMIHHVMVTER